MKRTIDSALLENELATLSGFSAIPRATGTWVLAETLAGLAGAG